MRYFKKLLGDRIYLSPINVEDGEKFTEWMNDFKVTDGTGRSSEMMNVEKEKEWIETTLRENKYIFSIVKLEDNQLIGNCSFLDIDFTNRTGTLGIMIGEEENRGKGYGKEAIRLLLDYGFNYLNINNINLEVASFNEKAINCYKKVGFKEIGKRRESYFLNGKYYDDIYMDILSKEFNEEYIKNKNI